MRKFVTLAFILSMSFPILTTVAADRPFLADGHFDIITGGAGEPIIGAARDTVLLIGPWGSGAAANGQFEDPAGAPAWNGWTSLDWTQRTERIWHVDTYNAVSGGYSAWCGEIAYSSCAPDDPVGGYGPDYDEWLSWIGVVGNVDVPTQVQVTAVVNHDTEPGCDFSYVGYWTSIMGFSELWTADGEGEQIPIDVGVTYQPGEYVGELGDRVKLTWRVKSDSGWDDADCSYYGDGALQVDDITVTLINDGVTTTFDEDFEDGEPLAEGGTGEWFVEFPPGVGDYAHIRANLDDLDECSSNYSPVACFIADEIMEAERGLPPQVCIEWCYGPGGYIVNTMGGNAGLDHHLRNSILSPVIPWPAEQYEGVEFCFDVYRHEDLSADAPGMFYCWGIRSTDSSDPDDIENAQFQDRDSGHYYGGPDWLRYRQDVTDLLVPGRTYVQVQLMVKEDGWLWDWIGDNGYPAPYFDNVRLSCFEYLGPSLAGHEADFAQDAFPADSLLHTGPDRILNGVRFDMAQNISWTNDGRNDPGDSVVISISAPAADYDIVTYDDGAGHRPPTLYFTVRLNPAFDDGMRLAGGQFTVNGGTNGELWGEITDTGLESGSGDGTMDGYVIGDTASSDGFKVPDRWQFDLPEIGSLLNPGDGEGVGYGLLYPGDVLHWYVEAWDEYEGDFRRARLPADISGYGDFSHPLAYPGSFVVHALPTMLDDTGTQPPILFWNDFANRGGEDEWYSALDNLGKVAGIDYDIFYTNSPSSGLGNGLGGRAWCGQLDGYTTLLYSSGDLTRYTITDLDYFGDVGKDVDLLDNWLDQGSRNLFATGDNLVSDLCYNSGPPSIAFVDEWMGITLTGDDLSEVLGGEKSPTAQAVPGNSVIQSVDSWIVYGGCPSLNTFDVYSPEAGPEQLAFFDNGSYDRAAAVLSTAVNGSRAIVLPCDLMFIRTAPAAKMNQPATLSARARLLGDVLNFFGYPSDPMQVTGVTPEVRFAAAAYPNPFNPAVKIAYTLPAAERLTLKIFNVRGELVRVLIDEERPEGPGFFMWDGTDGRGRCAASGVYFYELRAADDVMREKLVLLK